MNRGSSLGLRVSCLSLSVGRARASAVLHLHRLGVEDDPANRVLRVPRAVPRVLDQTVTPRLLLLELELGVGEVIGCRAEPAVLVQPTLCQTVVKLEHLGGKLTQVHILISGINTCFDLLMILP